METDPIQLFVSLVAISSAGLGMLPLQILMVSPHKKPFLLRPFHIFSDLFLCVAISIKLLQSFN